MLLTDQEAKKLALALACQLPDSAIDARVVLDYLDRLITLLDEMVPPMRPRRASGKLVLLASGRQSGEEGSPGYRDISSRE